MSQDVSSDEHAMQLNSLSSPRSRRQVQIVQDAFSGFWNQTKFQSGITPPFDRIEVAHLIQIAAEYVVYIHRHLAPEGVQLPVLQGCASELIWKMDWNPSSDPKKFVRALVHSAFKTQNGYVADLNESVVDEYIDEIDSYYSALPIHNPRHPSNSFCVDSNCDWSWAESLAKKLHERLIKIKEKHPSKCHSEYHSRWMKLCRELENANQMLDELLEIKEPESPKSPKTPATPHQARKARRKRRRNKLIGLKNEDIEDNKDNQKEATVTFEETNNSCEKTYENVQPSETETKVGEIKEGENQIQVEEEPEDSSVSLQIGKVSEDLEKRKQDIKSLLEESTLLQDDNDPEAAEQLVQKLQRRCLESSEYLMRNLLALDQLIVSNPKQRQQRKAQVLAIQDMLDTTDRMSQQLSALLRQYKSQREKEKEEENLKQSQPEQPVEESKVENKPLEVSETPNQPEESENKVAVVQEKPVSVPQPTKEHNIYTVLSNRLEELAQHALQPETWKKVKMEPQFQAIEQPQSYVIQGHLPGVNTKDISVDLSEDETVLLISGCRVPSTSDVSIMLSHLVQAIRQGTVNPVKLSQLDDEQLLLLVGSGRFGSFLTKYRLPENVDKQGIQAKIDRGVLKIILPKLQPRVRSIPTGAYNNHYGFPSLFGPSAWPVGSSYSLDDLFW